MTEPQPERGARSLWGRPGLIPAERPGITHRPPLLTSAGTPPRSGGADGPWAGRDCQSWGPRGAGGPAGERIRCSRGPGLPQRYLAVLCRAGQRLPLGSETPHSWKPPHAPPRQGWGSPWSRSCREPGGDTAHQGFGGALGLAPSPLLGGRKVSPRLFRVSARPVLPKMNFVFLPTFRYPVCSFHFNFNFIFFFFSLFSFFWGVCISLPCLFH